uniref:(northern house mosquito) hypothetical protein n=1 Tax=Culex pipiens TaxID=7175 RepID=A0A8D8FWY9_CULPI
MMRPPLLKHLRVGLLIRIRHKRKTPASTVEQNTHFIPDLSDSLFRQTQAALPCPSHFLILVLPHTSSSSFFLGAPFRNCHCCRCSFSPASATRRRCRLHASGTHSTGAERLLLLCLTVSCFSTYSDPLLAFCLDAPGFVDGPRTSVDKSTGLPGFRRRRVVTVGRFGGGYGRDRDVPRNKMASRPAVPSPERCRVAIVWRDDRRRGYCGCRVGHTGFRHPGLGLPSGTRSVHTEGSVGHNGAALEDGGMEMGWLFRG